jgi:hypothetical protein
MIVATATNSGTCMERPHFILLGKFRESMVHYKIPDGRRLCLHCLIRNFCDS